MADVDMENPLSMLEGMATNDSTTRRAAYLPGGDAGTSGSPLSSSFPAVAPTPRVQGPGPVEERRLVIEAEEAETGFQAGKFYCLVAAKWWNEWQKWCVDNSSDKGAREDGRPGPIDNRVLLETPRGTELKRGIMEQSDYMIVSESIWALLLGWYGGGPTLRRRAIASGSEVIVELHGLTLNVHRSSDLGATPTSMVESKATTVAAFKRHACDELGLECGKVRMWDYFNRKRHTLLEDRLDSTLEDCTMVENNDILLESQLEDGSWPSVEARQAASASHGEITRGTPPCVGVVGLQNLGNTCFMNSSIQCLANVPRVRDYFRNDEFRPRLNKQAFKTQGRLAETFAQLMRDMWNPNATQVAPREFKYQIGQFAEQFTGYRQHDSMEFIEYLLDGLKEDVNRVQGAKPFVELKEAEGRDDMTVAAEAHQNYRTRNDSYIDDLFLGLYKSTVTCTHPGCDRVSVKFDPFLSIKVPLTHAEEDRQISLGVAVVSRLQPIARHKVQVKKSGTIADLIAAAAKAAGLDPKDCVLAEVYLKKIYKFFEAEEGIDSVRANDVLVLYEVDEVAKAAAAAKTRYNYNYNYSSSGANTNSEAKDNVSPDRCGVVIQMRRQKPDTYGYGRRYGELVGMPLVTTVSRTSRASDLIAVVKAELERHVGPVPDGWTLMWTLERSQVEDCNTPLRLGDEAVTLESKGFAYLVVEWQEAAAVPEGVTQLQDAAIGGSNGSSDSKGANAVRLEKCIQMFTETDKLSGDDLWYCNKCKEHREAFKKMEFWSLPPVLILQLKRFTYTRYTRERLDTDVAYPLEGLDMTRHVMGPVAERQIFDLVALSMHGGSLGGGHYVAYARSSENGKWYYYNDSFCQEVQPSEVAKEQSGAYVLFYLRRDQRPASWGPPPAPPAAPPAA